MEKAVRGGTSPRSVAPPQRAGAATETWATLRRQSKRLKLR